MAPVELTTRPQDDTTKSKAPKRSDAKSEHFSYLKFLKHWAGDSSCNGIPNIKHAKTFPRRIFWLLLVLTGLGLTLWNIYKLVDNYFSYPVNISLNVTFANALPFPTVSICNANIIRKSMVHLAKNELQNVLPYTFGGNETAHLSTSQGRTELLNDFHAVYATLNESVRLAMGHQKETLIIDCQFDGESCSHENFREFNNPYYGNCFTFYPTEESDRNIHRPGPKQGLSMELFIEQYEYIAELTEIAGAVATINRPGIMPFPDAEGYFISPDRATFMGLAMMEITRLADPYPSKCWSLSPDEAMQYNVFSELANTTYSITGCQKTCYQRHVVMSCHCGDPLLPLEGIAIQSAYVDPTGQIPPCSTDAQVQCELDKRELFSENKLPCNCSVPCEDEMYVVTPSSAVWPSDEFAEIYYTELAARYPSFGDILAGRVNGSNPGSNLIKLKIYFEEFNFEKIAEVPAYGESAMLADLGGAFGFYLGLSIIALFEFVELLFDCLRIGIQRCNLSKKHATKTAAA